MVIVAATQNEKDLLRWGNKNDW